MTKKVIRRLAALSAAVVLLLSACAPAKAPSGSAGALTWGTWSNYSKHKPFLDLLEQAAHEKEPVVNLDEALCRRTFEVLPAGGLSARTRAMLKVEDGCVNFCSYCIIPYARGPVRSLPLDAAVREVRRLREEGYRELVLTGIEISSWGRDLPGKPGLAGLIEAVCREAGDMRVRLGSLEPRTITEDFCRRTAALPNLCPHFHLSLQSGCDATLARMNRKYDTRRYKESADLLNGAFRRPAITTDLIAGFPGETEEEFAATLDFIRSCGFAEMHIFPYSIRPGTPAAEMEQVPKALRAERARTAAEAAAAMRRAYLAECVGRTEEVLFEQPAGEEGFFLGHAPNYAEVRVKGEDLRNQIRLVNITGADGEVLLGELEE